MPYTDKEKTKAASRRHYEQYRDRIKQAQRDRRNRNRKYIQDFKVGKACKDCEVVYPPHILDFDHVRGEKICNLSRMSSSFSLEKIQEEIAKCDIVCSNCHRHRTWMRSKKIKAL